jgi:type I restriction enzyme S subunit
MTTTPSAVWVGPAQLRPSRLAAEFYRQEYTELEDQLDRSGHKLVVLGKLGRLFTGPFGSKLPASLYDTPNGVPLLRVQNIGELFLNETDLARIPLEVHEDIHRSKLEPGDLALAKAGRLGALSKIPAHIQECNITQHIVGVKVRADKVRGSYLAAFFLSRFGSFQLKRQGIGTLIKYLGIEETRAAKVIVPGRGVQDYIGAKVELAERCRAVASREHEKLGTELATLYEGCPYDALSSLTTIVAPAEIDGSRLDAWYHQRRFITFTEWLRRNPAFVELGKVASLSSDRWSPGAHGQSTFRYIEISNVDSSTGHVSHSEVPVENAPSRARKLVRGFDVLASTVRPNRGAVGLVPDSLDGAVATTGFAVVRPGSKTDAFFLLAVLRHPASTAQLMRCNTGSAYPAIEESVLPQIWIPGAKPGTRKSLGARELRRTTLLQTAVDLVDQAKADVEALIEGTLDVQAILARTVKAPTADDIPELAENDT